MVCSVFLESIGDVSLPYVLCLVGFGEDENGRTR